MSEFRVITDEEIKRACTPPKRRKRKLKVWEGSLFTGGWAGGRQYTECVIAAHSQKEACDIIGCCLRFFRSDFELCRDEGKIASALAKPLKVLN